MARSGFLHAGRLPITNPRVGKCIRDLVRIETAQWGPYTKAVTSQHLAIANLDGLNPITGYHDSDSTIWANWDGFEQRNLCLGVLQVVEALAGLVAPSYVRLGPSAQFLEGRNQTGSHGGQAVFDVAGSGGANLAYQKPIAFHTAQGLGHHL